MDSIKLMNRVDTKYITTEPDLVRILEKIKGSYSVLVSASKMIASYDTLYFDTDSLDMFMAHRNGHLFRQKIRTRRYVNSGETFLEIKRKDNHSRTKKKRIPINPELFDGFSGDGAAKDFIEKKSKYSADDVKPKVRTSFKRITLVDNNKTERITIDFDLTFENIDTRLSKAIPSLVIFEVKQDGQKSSLIKEALFELRIKPFRISKYCIGTALTNDSARIGRFKEKIHIIERITNIIEL